MPVKVKQLKKQAPKLGLGLATHLSRSIMALKVPTYQDVKRIETILAKLESINELRQKTITDFFKTHNLPETEVIDPSHPLYYEFENYYSSQTTEVSKTDVSLFSLKEFNASVDGLNINYGERKFMEFWLVEEEKEIK